MQFKPKFSIGDFKSAVSRANELSGLGDLQAQREDIRRSIVADMREKESATILEAVAAAGVDVREVRMTVYPDRTVYLANDKPIIEVFKPTIVNKDDGTTEIVQNYRNLYSTEN